MAEPLLIYLGGPIDNVDEETAQTWRIEAAEVFSQLGAMTFDPTQPYCHARTSAAKAGMMASNRAVMGVCSGGFFVINGQAFGTIREIEFFRNRGKPVMVCVPEDQFDSWSKHIEMNDVMLRSHLNDYRGLLDAAMNYDLNIGTIDQDPTSPAHISLDEEPELDIPKPTETIKEYHDRKSREAGSDKPYLPDRDMDEAECMRHFVMADLLYNQHLTGTPKIILDSKYWRLAANDHRKVIIDVIEHELIARIGKSSAGNTG